MAEERCDGNYLAAYSHFFADFVARVNPYDQLPVSVSSCNVTDAEILGEIVNVTLQYLNQTECPSSLQAHLVHQVVQEIKCMCKKQPEDCGYKSQEKTYTSLKLMQAITGKVNEICSRYLDNSRLALLPPPPSMPLPEVIAGASKNCRRKMEDRYVVLHNLNATFGIPEDSIANYYAVFDGHAGQDAAVYCATHLHQYLTESTYYPSDPERALHDAFITTDAQFIEKSKTQKMCGGTTAVCTLILNKKLYVAWAGDSSAILVKQDGVVQLVNPHRLHREDEVQRIRRMGGVVMRSMGITRVNGVLSVSRAIGDIQYKPFVTAEPEVKCVPLDGTEDFLVIASDGLTDYLEPAEILTLLYHEIRQHPNDLKRAHQVLLQWAKHAGSEDNITVLVVLLTPAIEIAARPFHRLQVDDILEKMNSKDKPLLLDIDDSHNAINSSILKQSVVNQDVPSENPEGDGILTASNGKHENGDADYDYSDLGPETNVDAVDDAPTTIPVNNFSYEFYKENHEYVDPEKESFVDYTPNEHSSASINDSNLQDEDKGKDLHGQEEKCKIEERVNDHERMTDTVDAGYTADHVPMEFNDSPPSPRADKPLQHAVTPEADNVADSEDSEDEWNYYRVDPNKERNSAASINEPEEARNKQREEDFQLAIEDTDLNLHSEDSVEDIECESLKEQSSELIDTQISVGKVKVEEEENEKEKGDIPFLAEQEKPKDMNFQLNPDATEFIPVSPQFLGNRANLMEDYPISGSPLKQVSQMDDIQMPSESEFEEEVCQRPSEVESEYQEKEYQNGVQSQHTEFADFLADKQRALSFHGNLDDSEISSTKAEFGDESSASFITAPEFHRTGISQIDESFSGSERDYDIAKDPMAMSFTPSDFEAAFDKGVDLNAVHNLSNTDLDDNNGTTVEKEAGTPEPHPDIAAVTPTEPIRSAIFTEEPSDLMNLSSQQEDAEATVIDRTNDSQATVDFFNLQPEPVDVDQQEVAKSDDSSLTENFSAEFESEKAAGFMDNERPLSPYSADIDQTKPLDEAGEETCTPKTDFQKEEKEADTTCSVSPVIDTTIEEGDLLTLAGKTEVNSAEQIESPPLHHNVPEFTTDQYSHSDNLATNEAQSHFETNEDNAMETGNSHFTETEDIIQSYSQSTEIISQSHIIIEPDNVGESMMQASTEQDEQLTEMESVEPSPQTKQEILLNFVEEEICQMNITSPVETKPTPPPSPQKLAEVFENTKDVCPIESTTEHEFDKIIETENETPEQIEIFETNIEEVDPVMKPTMILSESMQEFTGLESQLEPKADEEETLKSSPVIEVEQEISQIPTLEHTVEQEKLLEPAVEEEQKDEENERKKDEEVEEEIYKTSDIKEPRDEKAPIESRETTEIVAAATAATAVAATISAAAVQSKVKPTLARQTTKTTTTKTATKSTPTSSSKTVTAAAKVSTTTAKKTPAVTMSRLKDVETTKKSSTATSSTASKTSVSKALSKPTATAKSATRTVPTSTLKPKPTTASKPADKKATANGDVKSQSRPTSAKTTSKPAAVTKTTTSVKSSSTTTTRTSVTLSTATTRSKPVSSTVTVTSKLSVKSSTNTTPTTTTAMTTRPRTAPGIATKSHISTSAKPPIIDKQVKETANKQISMSKTNTVPKTSTNTRTSIKSSGTPKASSTTSRSSTTAALSPKKITKVSGKSSSTGKSIEKSSKIIQNGMSEKVEASAIIEDVPKKDLSPVITPNDNQLIITSD